MQRPDLESQLQNRATVQLEGPGAEGDPHHVYMTVRVNGFSLWVKGFNHSSPRPRHWRKAHRIANSWNKTEAFLS